MRPLASPVNQISPQAAQHTPCKIKRNVFFYYLFNVEKEKKKYVLQ